MIPILVIHFFIFLFLSSTLLADQEAKCEASDYCRVPGKVYPTYSNTTHHDCRDLPIDCTAETATLMATEEKRYQVKDLWRNKTVLIHDQFLQQQLKSKNCDATYITPSHTSSIFSFELISHNLTFFKCDRKQKVDDAVVGELIKYDGCPDEYILYYSYPKQLNESQLRDFYSLPLCSKAFLPLIHNPSTPKDNNPFSLFTADFYWKWRLKDKCLECFNGGGHCRANNISGPSECVPPINVRADSKSKRKSEIAIGLGTGAGASLLTILAAIFIFRRWRQKNDLHKNSTLISRSISPDLSMQPDPEKGSSYFNTPIFSYKELEEATNNFDSSKELGDGGFGTVYYGKLKDGRAVAVKRLYENNCKRVEQFMNEVNILSLLRHQNLVSLYGCTSRHSRELLLVYEYVANGTVADHLHGEHSSAGMVTWPIRLSIAIESADALVYLHASDIIHRDVKTNNILLDKNFHVKVADFGLSRLFPNDVTHVSTAPQGTPGYVDPDYYQCYQLTDKSDVYSFGVVLCELISSKPAVDINRHRHEINLSTMALNKIHGDALHELVDMSLGFNTNASVRKTMTLVAELAYRCLQQDTDARPSMAEVLEVLKEIEVEGSKVVKPGELTDDAKLLKNYPPVSPNSVTDKWASITSTPNTSS